MSKTTKNPEITNSNNPIGVFYRPEYIHNSLSSSAGSHTPTPKTKMSEIIFNPKKTHNKTSNQKFRKITSASLIEHLLKHYAIPQKPLMKSTDRVIRRRILSKRGPQVNFWSAISRRLSGSALAIGPFLKHTATLKDTSVLSYGRSSGTPVSSVFSRSLLANGPHLVNVVVNTSSPLKPQYFQAEVYSTFQSDMRRVRMRFERWFFTNLGCRTYVWFSDIWKSISSELDDGCLSGMYARCVRQLTRRGNRFILRAAQAYVTFQSIVLAVTSVTGLQFFMKMTIRLLKRHRSHWAVLMYMLGFFNVCKNHFWFKTLFQYRLVVRGKFGGYMRASQKVFQHGIVKIHQWDLKINYYRLCPVTKYGVFSVRFWVQMRDMRQVRFAAVTGNISGSKLLREHLGSFPVNP